MTATYEKIATTTLGSASASTTFSSISSSYTDLVLITQTKMSGLGQITMRLNSDTGSNYSYTEMYGTGSSVASDRGTGNDRIYFGNFSNSTSEFTIGIFNIQNYSNTTTNKTVLSRVNTSSVDVVANVGLWRNTSAINSVTILTSGSTFTTGSTFTLYGIKAE